jgi:hypothetical protein
MRIIAIICDYAEIREGLLTIVSGGITRLWRPQLPAPMGVFLALQVEVEPKERPFPHELEVRITGPSDKEVGKVNGGFQIGPSGDFEPDECAYANVPLDLRMIALDEFGWYRLAISIDGGEAYPLRVRVGLPPVPATHPGIRTAPHADRTH